MRRIRDRILRVIGAGGLAMQSLAACGSTEDTAPTSDAAPDSVATEDGSGSGTPEGAKSDTDTPEDAMGALDATSTDGSPDSAAEAGTGADVTGEAMGEATVSNDARPDVVPSVRRPFLVGASLRSARALARSDWGRELVAPPKTVDAYTVAALHRAWLHDALQEHASVAAFARFTLQLLAVGAPPELVVASQRASLDEIAHARACFGLALRYGGIALGPSPLEVDDALGPTSLESVARLAAEEGCVGETLGAALAAEQLRLAEDTEVAAVLGKIAVDELRHAELAWSFARWAIEKGGEPTWHVIEAAVRDAVAATRRVPLRRDAADEAAWNAHGRLTCAQARRASERAIKGVIEPCLTALANARTARGPLRIDGRPATTA